MASKIQCVHICWCSFNCSVADPDLIWIQIHRILMFLGLLDPDPDPFVRGVDPDLDPAPDPDPSYIKQR